MISYDITLPSASDFPQKIMTPGTNVTYAFEDSILKMMFLFRKVGYLCIRSLQFDKWPILEADVKTWENSARGLKWDPEAKTKGSCEQWNQLTDHIYLISIYILSRDIMSYHISLINNEGYSKRKTDILIYFPKKKSCRFQLQTGCWLKIWVKGSSFSVFQSLWAIEDLTK